MSSATVLDSIIEGVRADVATREAAVSMAELSGGSVFSAEVNSGRQSRS